MNNYETLKQALDQKPSQTSKLFPYFKDISIIQQFVQANGISFFNRICPFIRYQIYKSLEVVLEFQKPVNAMYFLLYGRLGVFQQRQMIQVIEGREAFEDLTFLGRQSSQYTYIAESECLIAFVYKEDFFKVVHPKKIELSLVNELLAFPSFSEFMLTFLEQITQRCIIKTYSTYSKVYTYGDACNNWYIIRKGLFQMHYYNGNSCPLIQMTKGEYFGEIEIINQSNRRYQVIALENGSEVFEISKTSLLYLMGRNAQFKQMVMESYSNKVQQYDQQEKKNKMLKLPLFHILEKPRPFKLSSHIRIKNQEIQSESVEQLRREKRKEQEQMMQYRTQRLIIETERSNEEKLKDRNPRLQQFLQRLKERKVPQKVKHFRNYTELPDIPTNSMQETTRQSIHTITLKWK